MMLLGPLYFVFGLYRLGAWLWERGWVSRQFTWEQRTSPSAWRRWWSDYAWSCCLDWLYVNIQREVDQNRRARAAAVARKYYVQAVRQQLMAGTDVTYSCCLSEVLFSYAFKTAELQIRRRRRVR